tara:strand:+ start:1191 stop:1838 length:648 start_codon:yes stop_codon:yes gene_type:complete
MTRNEMIIEGRLFVDKVHSDAYPEITKREWDVFLTESQNRFFKTRYGKNNLYQKGYEESQKRRDDLSKITTVKYLQNIGGVFSLDTLYSDELLSSDSGFVYSFHLNSEAKTNGCGVWESIDVVDHDTYTTIKNDPFNEPDLDNPIATFIDLGMKVEPLPEAVKITCVRIPKNISETQDCELSEHTHKEIVQLAVNLVIESVESPRIQTHSLNNIE